MPASYAHYNFAKELLPLIDNQDIKKIIQDNIDYYYLGTHGPDIFFFSLLNKKVVKKGKSLHHQKAKPFFQQALNIISNDQQLAYIIGFIAHYSLDHCCHGYVSKIMKETKYEHFEVESEYDRRLMMKNNINPVRHHLVQHLKSGEEIATNIQPFVSDLSCKEVDDAIKYMKFFDRVLLAPNPFKRSTLYLVFHLSFHFNKFQGLVMNYKPNQELAVYFDKFDHLYHNGLELAKDLIKDFYSKLESKQELDNKFNHNYY